MEQPGFVSDISFPHMLYALTIRSPVAKGKLSYIDCPKLPGGYTLITAGDIPGKNCLENSPMPVLAADVLSYIGEPVALLLGPDKDMLEKIAVNCKVIAEEEPPVFTHTDTDDNMILTQQDIKIGDSEAAFLEAQYIVNGVYTTGIQYPWFAEPSGAVAWLKKSDGSAKVQSYKRNAVIMVSTVTQWPFHVKRSVAQLLDLTLPAVSVRPAVTGHYLDGKLWYPSLISCHAALGAWLTERPVQLMLSRREDFCFSPKRFATEISIASAHDEKSDLIGLIIKARVNLGAYEVNVNNLLDYVFRGCIEMYKTKNIHFSGTVFKTNIPPQGSYTGLGLTKSVFAMERHSSRIAEHCKQDPALRRIEYCKDEKLVETAMKMSDYSRKWASYNMLRQNRKQRISYDSFKGEWIESGEILRGIGLALGYQNNETVYPGNIENGKCGIELILQKDEVLEIRTSSVSPDCSIAAIWSGMAAEILGIDTDKVRIIYSADYLDSGPATMSHNIVTLTPLVKQACISIHEQRLKKSLPITVRKLIKPQDNPDRVTMGWASAVVEIEINPVEFIPVIRGVWMCVNGGKILSENEARRSLKLSVIQALGWAYKEQISYVNGVIPEEQYENFDMFGPLDIPEITIDFIENNAAEPSAPAVSLGIGGLPFSCVPAAFLQAVSQALDYQFQSIPLKSQDIWYTFVRKRA
ncbi:MAG: molybdopterin-dependent oxidoreductase [Treponema sp.]|nr:molybdopterin-dependent oxidoreductase [Treponema sp.]